MRVLSPSRLKYGEVPYSCTAIFPSPAKEPLLYIAVLYARYGKNEVFRKAQDKEESWYLADYYANINAANSSVRNMYQNSNVVGNDGNSLEALLCAALTLSSRERDGILKPLSALNWLRTFAREMLARKVSDMVFPKAVSARLSELCIPNLSPANSIWPKNITGIFCLFVCFKREDKKIYLFLIDIYLRISFTVVC